MKIKTVEEDFIFNEFFKVRKSRLQHELYDGTMSEEVIRYSVDKKDGVAAILIDEVAQQVILVEQFRFPMAEWLTEVVAGGLETNESKTDAIQREIMEETGYHVYKLDLISQFYVSPGLISEQLWLFAAYVDPTKQQIDTSDIKDEGEDIRLIRIDMSDIEDYLRSGKIVDGKTLIAFYHLILYLQHQNTNMTKIKATVKHMPLNMGFWALTTTSGDKYEVINMPEQIKVNDLQVEVLIRKRPEISTMNMYGTPVDIVGFSTV